MDKNEQSDTLDLKTVEQDMKGLLENNLPANVYFHGFGNSLVIKEEAMRLAKASGLKKEQQELLGIVALFLNSGYTKSYDDHVKESQLIAATYMEEAGVLPEKINKILNLMRVPFSDNLPSNIKEKIIHDSYYSYYGLKRYKSRMERLRKEKEENITDYLPSNQQWEEERLNDINTHHFFTQAAIDRYAKRVKKNIAKSKKRLKQELKKEAVAIDKFSIANNKAAITMFKTALRNHIDLTSIADQKSNMMLSVNALLLTIGMPIFASYLSDKLYLLVPAVMFLLTCIITMVFATLSTRPIKMTGDTNLERLHSGKTNLFFFGNFYKIGLEPYTEAIKKVIANPEHLDASIINDLYYLGSSLGYKFYYLRLCYNVFISGICISALAFVISYIIAQ